MSNTSPLLTTSEAAQYLRLSAPTLERLRCTGEGPPFIKLGSGKRARVAYRLADLEAFITQNRRHSTGDAGDMT
ncbi:MAG: helix-turn-helix domain-containing protein [Hyphomicrobium zavarzinii]|nr:helix-turn-helix domain-containing protein [Hyphomicrobium zavarzinii]